MSWTTPAPSPAGGALTSTFWDAQVKANFDVIGGAWTAYTPAISGWTLGNGTVAAAYAQADKWIRLRMKVTFGSTSVSAAALTFTLPVAPHNDWASGERWVARDISPGASYFGDCDLLGGSASAILRVTTPFTWAAGDFIGIELDYETA